MRFGKVSLAAATALSVASAPVLAQASNPTAAAPARAGAEMDDANELRGGIIIPLLALIAVVLGILVVLDDDEDAESP